MFLNRYTQLSISLIILFVLSPFLLKVEMDFPLVSFLFLVVVLLALRALRLRKSIFAPIAGLAFSAFLFECLINFHFFHAHKTLVSAVVLSSFALFIGLSVLIMIHNLFTEQIVNADSIQGGIAIYLLLGVFWAIVYELVLVLNPTAFVLASGPAGGDVRYLLFYFSFTTLTTLGYGDVLPASEITRVLAALESVMGVLFLTVFIAQLVGLHVFHRTKAKRV